MTKRKVIRSLLAITVGLGVVGCEDKSPSGVKKQEDIRIALVMKARTNPFFAEMERGATEKAKELGVTLDSMAIDSETDATQQAGLVETAVGKKYDAILIAPADSKGIVHPLLQAQRRGMKIINIDNRIDPATAKEANLDVLTFIGPDNAAGARKSTEALIESMGGQGEVAMIEGIRGVDNAEARKRGFEQAVKATDGKVTVVAMNSANWESDPALALMESWLTRYPELDGVFCANDSMALGAVSAIDKADKTDEILVTAYDNLKAAQQLIREGKLLATIEQHPAKMGAQGVEVAVRSLKGEEVKPEYVIETDLVTARNLDQFAK